MSDACTYDNTTTRQHNTLAVPPSVVEAHHFLDFSQRFNTAGSFLEIYFYYEVYDQLNGRRDIRPSAKGVEAVQRIGREKRTARTVLARIVFAPSVCLSR